MLVVFERIGVVRGWSAGGIVAGVGSGAAVRAAIVPLAVASAATGVTRTPTPIIAPVPIRTTAPVPPFLLLPLPHPSIPPRLTQPRQHRQQTRHIPKPSPTPRPLHHRRHHKYNLVDQTLPIASQRIERQAVKHAQQVRRRFVPRLPTCAGVVFTAGTAGGGMAQLEVVDARGDEVAVLGD